MSPDPAAGPSSFEDLGQIGVLVPDGQGLPIRLGCMPAIIPEPANKEDADEEIGDIATSARRSCLDHFAELTTEEAEILHQQLAVPTISMNFRTLYRYATVWDLVIIYISAICAIVAGAAMPIMMVVFSNLSNTFQDYLVLHTATTAQFYHTLNTMVLYFVYLAIGEFFACYITMVGFIYTGEHISSKVREQYLAACLRQNIGFYDNIGAGAITTHIVADTNLIQEAISEKISLTIVAIATFIAAFVIGFIKSWKLTLILSSAVVAITILMGLSSSFIVKYNQKALDAYALGGSLVEEVISSIRNATAFGTQEKLAKQYDMHLIEAKKWGLKTKLVLALLVGATFGIIYLDYALAFWMGSRLLVKGEIGLSAILSVLLSIMIGAFSLGNVAPNMQTITSGVSAATQIFSTIDRKSPIDPSSSDGGELKEVIGRVELRNIKHIYPSRPDVVVMHDVNLIIPAGKMTALVGASGSGKSTIVGLLERFYDPVRGQIFLDGHDIQKLNLKWLRQQISLVGQEPTLFSTTIYENIRHGIIGSQYENEIEERQKELIISAAKMANAHNFVTALPDGYDTNVGQLGFLLSGGQKQRIAIARAIVCNPKILLLDEATSALDTKSEGIVQAAIDVAAAGRTTISIAHRLSTIRNADNIVVMSEGGIIEQGTHSELLQKQGAYYQLVEAQRIEEDLDEGREENGSHAGDEKLHPLPRDTSFEPLLDADKSAVSLTMKRSRRSVASIALQAQDPERIYDYSVWRLSKVIASFNRQEWRLMILGLVFSIICGGGNPTQSVLFSKEIVALSLPLDMEHTIRVRSDYWCHFYLMLALVEFISFSGQGLSFAICSERMIHRVRDRAFRAILRQDIGFFDRDENTAGALTSFLATRTTFLAGLSGVTLGTLLTATTTLVVAIIVSCAIGWKLALVCMGTIPILLGCGFFRFIVLAQFQSRARKSNEETASYACEAASAIRTVASLTREDDVIKNYRDALTAQRMRSLRSVLKSSLLYAASQSFMFLCVAAGFRYGGYLIAEGELDMFQFFLCFSAIIFGSQSAGTIFSFAPDMSKAKEAASELQKLFDRVPPIDSWSMEGDVVDNIQGSIEFRDVHFRYPTRPAQAVLRGLDLTILPGQYVALVGASGCGKSTIIALLERFYNPTCGSILVDGKDISEYNIKNYRSFLALVSQEPMLYQGTIRENICLGVEREDVSDEEIESACREANIYNFIMSLPDGFSTAIGSKGTLLSGGQKQRLAIARALLRDPRILLLDEATSALDSESEALVQAALDAAARGRTTIAIAHRLSTIQRAHHICLLDQGRVVEQGTHAELLRLPAGRYAELVQLQSLARGSAPGPES